MNCDFTELWLDGTANCYLPELWLDWTSAWPNCDLTDLLLDWSNTCTWLSTVTWQSCCLPELLLDWFNVWPNCYRTELLLDRTNTWLDWYLTELTWLNSSCLQNSCLEKWPSWKILVTYETSFTWRGATDATLQPHQIVRLPHKNDSWLILITYETLFTMRGATDVTLQPHQTLRLPRNLSFRLSSHLVFSDIAAVQPSPRIKKSIEKSVDFCSFIFFSCSIFNLEIHLRNFGKQQIYWKNCFHSQIECVQKPIVRLHFLDLGAFG